MAIDTAQLDEIIRSFMTNTSHAQGAAIVTHEGLLIASALPDGL